MLATDLYPEKIPGDEPEPLEVVLWPLERIDQLVYSHDLSEARTIATLKIVEITLNGDLPSQPILITAN